MEGTLNLLLAARDQGVRRVVVASSSSVYGDAPSSQGRLDGITVLELFAEALEGGSKSAARRTASQGGAYVNNRQERDLDRPVREPDLVAGRYLLLRKGRKRYHLVRFG